MHGCVSLTVLNKTYILKRLNIIVIAKCFKNEVMAVCSCFFKDILSEITSNSILIVNNVEMWNINVILTKMPDAIYPNFQLNDCLMPAILPGCSPV